MNQANPLFNKSLFDLEANPFFNNQFTDMAKKASGNFDFDGYLNNQRKTVEAFITAGKAATEGYQVAFKKQADLVAKYVEETPTITKEILAQDESFEKAYTRRAAIARKQYDRFSKDMGELATIVTKAQEEAQKIVVSSLSQNIDQAATVVKEQADKVVSATAVKTATK